MNPGSILVRVVLAYVFVQLLLRLSGKRTIAEATPFDFVLAVILGDLFDDLFWAEVPASQFVVATGALVFTHVLASTGSALSEAFETITEGPRRLLMRNGKPIRKTMRREHLNDHTVEMLLAQQAGLSEERWPEVKDAIIEQSGDPSVVLHEWARPATEEDRERLRAAKT